MHAFGDSHRNLHSAHTAEQNNGDITPLIKSNTQQTGQWKLEGRPAPLPSVPLRPPPLLLLLFERRPCEFQGVIIPPCESRHLWRRPATLTAILLRQVIKGPAGGGELAEDCILKRASNMGDKSPACLSSGRFVWVHYSGASCWPRPQRSICWQEGGRRGWPSGGHFVGDLLLF